MTDSLKRIYRVFYNAEKACKDFGKQLKKIAKTLKNPTKPGKKT